MRVSTEILISVLRIAADEEDGQVNKSKFIMAADRLGELNARIKRLEEELMDTKNEYAVLVADVVLRDDKLERIEQLERSYAAKDDQLCNLLEICRSNGIEVSSQDLINGKEEA